MKKNMLRALLVGLLAVGTVTAGGAGCGGKFGFGPDGPISGPFSKCTYTSPLAECGTGPA